MKKEKIVSAAVTAAGLIAFGLSSGVWDVPVMAWIWPGCLLLSFRHLKKGRPILSVSLLLFAASIVKLIGFSDETVGSLIVGVTVFIETLVPLLLDRVLRDSLKKRIGHFSCLLMPLTFIALQSAEQAALNVTPILAASVTGWRPLLQSASVIGAQGLSLFMLCFSAAMAETVEALMKEDRRALHPAGLAAGVLALLLIAGEVRLAAAGTDEPVRVAMALTPMDPRYYTEYDTSDLASDKAFLRLAAEKAKMGGASLLVFGEEAFSMQGMEEKTFTEFAYEQAKEKQIAILLPMESWKHSGENGWIAENKEILIDAHGEKAGEYVKSKLIPLIETENYVRGDGKILFASLDLGGGEKVGLSSVICFDADHALYVSRIGKETRLLFVPSWCWDGVDPYHTEVMRLRAVETGVPVVNPALGSTSAVLDRYGNTVCSFTEAELLSQTAVLTDISPGRGGKTAYRVLAYPICGLIDLAALALLIFGIRLKKKEKTALR